MQWDHRRRNYESCFTWSREQRKVTEVTSDPGLKGTRILRWGTTRETGTQCPELYVNEDLKA